MSDEGSVLQPQGGIADTPIPMDKYLTYRLRGIPDEFDGQGLKDLVKQALNLEISIDVTVKSLASDPSRQGKKIATLDFSGTPARLSKQTETREWKVPTGDNRFILLFDTHFRGFTPLHKQDDKSCTIDLIAISGLASHAFGSFKARDDSYMWLRDTLPNENLKMRILIYGYDTRLEGSTSIANLDDLSNVFQSSVKNIRSYVRRETYGLRFNPERPLILLGHSLGGIVIKAALNRMVSGDKSDIANFNSIRGMLFFGVPNQGMPIDRWVPIVGNQPNRFFIEQLGKASDILKIHRDTFRKVFTFKDSHIYSFYETEKSPTIFKKGSKWDLTGPLSELVDRASATHGRHWEESGGYIKPIHQTHSNLVKFASAYDDNYDTVLHCLSEMAHDACDVIEKRFRSTQDIFRSLINDVTTVQFLTILSKIGQTGHIRTTKLSKPPWVFENMDYKLWNDSHNYSDRKSRIIWLSGPSESNIYQISSCIMHEHKSSEELNPYIFHFSGWATTTENPTATCFIYTLLYQIIYYSPEDKKDSVIKGFFNGVIKNIQAITEGEQQLRQFLEEGTLDMRIEKILNEAVDQCWAALSKVLIGMGEQQEMLIVVDGLNRTDSDTKFLKLLRELVSKLLQSDLKVKVVLTSLPAVNITGVFGKVLHIGYDIERKECLYSLRFDNTRFRKIVKKHKGTFEWFWNCREYVAWSATKSSSIFLLEGKPGSGKSTFMKFFSDNLIRHEFGTDSPIVAKYFYSAREDELQTSHYNMLRSILYDILYQNESSFYRGFQSAYRVVRQESSESIYGTWSYEQLKQALILLLKSQDSKRKLYIIIDAVDEADDEDRSNILELLFGICSEIKQCMLKVFIASRPAGKLGSLTTKHADIAYVLRLQEHTQSDIGKFSESFMENLNFGNFRQEATEYIVQHAQGVFIWVELVRRQLIKFEEKASPKADIFKFLKGLPDEIEDMYKLMLNELRREEESIVKRAGTMFQFVLFASRSLTLNELIHAACISENRSSRFEPSDTHSDDISLAKRFYITVCGGNFLEYDESTKTVQVIHQTVREFFLKGGLSKIEKWTCVEDGHFHISTTCLLYFERWAADMSETLPNLRIWTRWPTRTRWPTWTRWAIWPRQSSSTSWTSEHFEKCARYLEERPLIRYAIGYLKYHMDRSHKHISSKFLSTANPAAYLLGEWANSAQNPNLPSIRPKGNTGVFKGLVLLAAIKGVLCVATEVLIMIGAANAMGQDEWRLLLEAAEKPIVDIFSKYGITTYHVQIYQEAAVSLGRYEASLKLGSVRRGVP